MMIIILLVNAGAAVVAGLYDNGDVVGVFVFGVLQDLV
jgi:hypothetical protein